MLYLDRAVDPIGIEDYVFGGPGITWWSISVLDDKPRPPGTAATVQHRSDRSVARRAIYGLKRRGLIESYFGTGAYAAQRQLNVHISEEGIQHVSTHMSLLERAHVLRRRLADDTRLSRAEVVRYAKTSSPTIGDAEYFRRCALEELDREIDLDNFEHLILALDEYFDLDFRQYVDLDLDDDFDDALFGLMLSEPAHPFLMSLMLYRARRKSTT
ncbi:hypothetical protein [Nocardia sp. NBC_01009]|uniref:hypothetical protein n=1 Tax=Nocardia sp. NBC_01009 TaxID=2975996 RepID=UPI00386FAF32|nr:hypothetical protein OHA42_17665 [Nocardia sp. NBC_01009]